MQRKHNSNLTNIAKILRKNMTKEEKRLWYDFLREYPVRFLRQKVIDNFIVDFYCHDARLIIEVDGSQHYTEDGIMKDRIRTEQINMRGLTVLRISNAEINKNFDSVCNAIHRCVQARMNMK